jgi:hypothetical protein
MINADPLETANMKLKDGSFYQGLLDGLRSAPFEAGCLSCGSLAQEPMRLWFCQR